ncbi:MAG: GNAT family N-acetyltransferase [Burkholderiales bacterium]
MRIEIIPKSNMACDQIQYLDELVSAPEHIDDQGACQSWKLPAWTPNLYAIVDIYLQRPIGILYVMGDTNFGADVAWWIDSKHRRDGYGHRAVDLCAELLKAKGVTRIGRILVQGDYSVASNKLLKRLLEHF